MTLPALFITLALASIGPLPVVAWVAATALAACWLVRRVRATKRPEGATCDCCTSTVHDPVEVR